jgi:hypothetical protein
MDVYYTLFDVDLCQNLNFTACIGLSSCISWVYFSDSSIVLQMFAAAVKVSGMPALIIPINHWL